MTTNQFHSDVLIIGSGGAGLRAAIELHDHDVDVLVVGKCKRREAHTMWARGGINAALGTMDKKDHWKIHAADTIRDGGFINDPEAVVLLAKHAPAAVKELAKWGARFARTKEGKIAQRFFGAATYRRACFVGDRTGLEILNVLVDQVTERNVRFKSEIYIFALLQNKGRVNGALGLDMRTGTVIVFHCKLLVLATGGHSRMFRRSSSHFWENNGDGIALAREVGAEFMDMEMFQFHPTGMLYPKQMEGVLVTEAVRGEGGILTNKHGERFMKRYDPKRMELSARDVVARAIYHEVQAGRGTRRGGVWLDISHKSKTYIKSRLPQMFKQFNESCNIDISKQKMEVAPTAHYSMGGIAVDHKTGKTSVDGLYAIGEVTSGVHGGNRLGGNSLAEILVFGKLTGRQLIKDVERARYQELNAFDLGKKLGRFYSLFDVKKGVNPLSMKREIQEIMWKGVGVERNAKSMQSALKALAKLSVSDMHITGGRKMNEKLIAALDVKNMLATCEMIIQSALLRKESRAAHYRSDYKRTTKRWLKNIYCIPSKDGFRLDTRPVPDTPRSIQRQLKKEGPGISHLLE